jgi:serine/threonine-protein kinase
MGVSSDHPAHGTLVVERAQSAREEHRRATERLFLVGCIAWPAFILHDFAGVLTGGDIRDFGWFVVLRALGEMFALPCYLLIRAKRVTPRSMAAMDFATFALGGALLAVMALRIGGLESRHMQGVMIFIFARCTVLPLPWRRAFLIPLVCALSYPLTLALLSFFVPELRAQWTSRTSVAPFVDNFLFVLAGLAVGVFASDLIYNARRQVFEARKLGNYRLKARIGRGGVGEVWLARQLTLERDVALKVLRDQASRSIESIKRFQREARATSKLAHPNTIRIIDFGASDDGVLYIAMELLQGMDLDAIVETYGPLSAARAIHLARQACGSLAEAHAQGILHRDIKPANLFVAELGREHDVVKVLDFGVARFAEKEAGASLTETGALTGTPDYMPPETCAGDSEPDARSDIYSLGASIYFMVTGTTLFPNRGFGEVVMLHISKMPETPSTRLGARVPQDLERVIMKCLAKDPKGRYASVSDVERDLAACEDADAWTKDDARVWWASPRARPRLKSAS